MFNKALLTTFALAGVIFNHSMAYAAGVPKANTTRILDERQDTNYVVPFNLDYTAAYGFSDISCYQLGSSDTSADTVYGSNCQNNAAFAIQQVLNEYASVLQSWTDGGECEDYGTLYGYDDQESIVASIIVGCPSTFYPGNLEVLLSNWDSISIAINLANYMVTNNVIQMCIEFVNAQNSGPVAGGAPLMIGWNNAGYYTSPDETSYFFSDCNRYGP